MGFKIVDDIWKELHSNVINDDFLLITDANIYNIYKNHIDKLIDGRDNIYMINPGEKSKNLEELTNIFKKLINKEISRQGLILSLGGGVVGDISGFAAATYKRGIPYIQIPTTLLSQVDSSIGGKTGIDFLGIKNIIGSFYFPISTLIYTSFIDSLPEREVTCGLGEIIKYGLIADYDFFKYVKNNIPQIYNKDNMTLTTIIKKSIDIKTLIFQEDKYDKGVRQKLNFGHTIGHGIESLFNYERFNHGEAIILGMIYESKIAFEKDLIQKDYYNEILSSLEHLVKGIEFNGEMIDNLLEYMKNDKKNINKKISFCLPIGEGKVDIFNNIDESSIRKALL